MAKGILRAKAKAKGGNTVVKIMAKHAMETGNRKDKNRRSETGAHDGEIREKEANIE